MTRTAAQSAAVTATPLRPAVAPEPRARRQLQTASATTLASASAGRWERPAQ